MNTRVLGIDPGLCNTGWGVIERYAYRTTWIAHGVIKTRSEESLPDRLIFLNREMDKVMQTYHPHAFCIEEIFMNSNPESTLKLGMARGVLLMLAGVYQLPVYEFRPNHVKKTVTGSGHADKEQMIQMIQILLSPKAPLSKDAADALAIAFCYNPLSWKLAK